MTLLNVSTQGLTLQFLWLSRSCCAFLPHPSHCFYKYILSVSLSGMARMGEVRADCITISKTDSSQSGGLLGPPCHETTKANGGYVYRRELAIGCTELEKCKAYGLQHTVCLCDREMGPIFTYKIHFYKSARNTTARASLKRSLGLKKIFQQCQYLEEELSADIKCCLCFATFLFVFDHPGWFTAGWQCSFPDVFRIRGKEQTKSAEKYWPCSASRRKTLLTSHKVPLCTRVRYSQLIQYFCLFLLIILKHFEFTDAVRTKVSQ